MSSAQDFLPLPLDRPTPVPDSYFRHAVGGSLICCMVMLVLYGMSVLQTYLYYLNYPNDRRMLKILVMIIFCMSTLQAIFCCHSTYHYTILSYHNPLLIVGGEWSLFMVAGVGVIVCFLVQGFYTRMIYLLTKGKWQYSLTLLLVPLILVQLGFGVLTVIREFQEWNPVEIGTIALGSMVPILATRVASDLVTAVSLCVLLHGTQPHFAVSGKLMHTLIVYAINRFLLTTVVVIVQMIVLICAPSSIWAMTVEYASAHLYVNSCLATLNSRNHLRNIGKSGTEPADYLNTDRGIQFDHPRSRTTGRTKSSVNINPSTMKTSDIVAIETGGSVEDEKPGAMTSDV